MVLVPLVACILAIALYPGLITEDAEPSVDRSLASVPHGDGGRIVPPGWTGYAPLADIDEAAARRVRRTLHPKPAEGRRPTCPSRRRSYGGSAVIELAQTFFEAPDVDYAGLLARSSP